MQQPRLRAEADKALRALEAAVGPLGQRDISWLVLRGLNAEALYPDGTREPAPSWSDDPRVGSAAEHLLLLVTMLGRTLVAHGVPLDPEGLSDRLVIAQLLTLPIPWDEPNLARDHLNIASVGSVRSDGSGMTRDRHAKSRETRDLEVLMDELRGPVARAPNPPREGMLDESLRKIHAQHPNVTWWTIKRAVDKGEDWVEPLTMLGFTIDPSTLRGAWKRAQKGTTN
jgi:hypothetical protein